MADVTLKIVVRTTGIQFSDEHLCERGWVVSTVVAKYDRINVVLTEGGKIKSSTQEKL